jgi:ELWxxDGT repeat protein
MKRQSFLFIRRGGLTILALSLLIATVAHANEPFMLKDIYPGAGSSNSAYLTDVNGTLFFQAADGTNGYELWKSDGILAGTVMVKDIWPGLSGSSPSNLTDVNGTLFFDANDGTNGYELWKSDGTAAGTVMVKDIWPGSTGSNPGYLTDVNGTVFFAANDGNDADGDGAELWKSDGTSAGTVLVKDIYPGSSGSSPSFLTNVNGILFFQANNSTNGYELWKSDGTTAGTVLVKDIYPGSGSSYPSNLTSINGTLLLFFSANDGSNGTELWLYRFNDECQNALGIYSGQTYYCSNYGAEGNDLTSCAYNDFADVWFYFQPQVSGEYTISAGSSEFDTTLAVFNACGGNELACNDDYYQDTNSLVSLNMIKGKRYYIRVAGFNGQQGSFELSVSAGACSALAASDLNGDCVVDMRDFAIMASEWLVCNKTPPELCGQ